MVAFLQALQPAATTEAWALLALLAALLAAALGLAAPRRRPAPAPAPARGRTPETGRRSDGGRAVALAAGLAGLLLAMVLLAQTAVVVGRAFWTGGPPLLP